MITIENCRPVLLLLPLSKVTLKPKGRAAFPESSAEIERAVKAGWVRIVEPDSSLRSDEKTGDSAHTESDTSKSLVTESPVTDSIPAGIPSNNPVSTLPNAGSIRPATHDWLIDYSDVENGNVSISDRSTGKMIVAEIAEKKGEQHFTLKTLGTVKGQQLWPTAQALERFDAAE